MRLLRYPLKLWTCRPYGAKVFCSRAWMPLGFSSTTSKFKPQSKSLRLRPLRRQAFSITRSCSPTVQAAERPLICTSHPALRSVRGKICVCSAVSYMPKSPGFTFFYPTRKRIFSHERASLSKGAVSKRQVANSCVMDKFLKLNAYVEAEP